MLNTVEVYYTAILIKKTLRSSVFFMYLAETLALQAVDFAEMTMVSLFCVRNR